MCVCPYLPGSSEFAAWACPCPISQQCPCDSCSHRCVGAGHRWLQGVRVMLPGMVPLCCPEVEWVRALGCCLLWCCLCGSGSHWCNPGEQGWGWTRF